MPCACTRVASIRRISAGAIPQSRASARGLGPTTRPRARRPRRRVGTHFSHGRRGAPPPRTAASRLCTMPCCDSPKGITSAGRGKNSCGDEAFGGRVLGPRPRAEAGRRSTAHRAKPRAQQHIEHCIARPRGKKNFAPWQRLLPTPRRTRMTSRTSSPPSWTGTWCCRSSTSSKTRSCTPRATCSAASSKRSCAPT